MKENIFVEASAKCDSYHAEPLTVPAAAADKDIVIITENTDPDANLGRMIERFRAVLPYASRVVNISEYPPADGCLGCFHCAVSEKCVYKDGFDTFLHENIYAQPGACGKSIYSALAGSVTRCQKESAAVAADSFWHFFGTLENV